MSAPLIDRLTDELGYPLLDEHTLDTFIEDTPLCVLFFTEDPRSFPESNDVAVILPELVSAFDGDLVPAVIAREAERALYKRYGFREWPTLVFLRNGAYLGAISRVQDWDVYLRRARDLLDAEPAPVPRPGLPVQFGSTKTGACGRSARAD